MNYKKLIVPLIVIILVAGAVTAVVLAQQNEPAPSEKQIVDARGRTVTVPADVSKIVCLLAGSLRIVSYLDAIDKVVGIDSVDKGESPIGSPAYYDYATYRLAYADSISKIENVGSESNQKAIIGTGADLIISSKESVDDLNTLQEQTGIPVIAVNAEGSVTVQDDNFRKNINIVASAIGKEDRAKQLLGGIDSILNELKGYAGKVTDKKDCYVGGMFYMKKGGLEMTTGNYLPFDLAAAKNVMPDSNKGNPYQTDIKTIADSGAEYLFIDTMTNSASKTTFDANKETLEVLPAVTDGNIFSLFVYKYYGTNWESELYNAYYIGSVLYGDVYKYDVKEKVNAVLDLFYINSDLDYDELMSKQSPGLVELEW